MKNIIVYGGTSLLSIEFMKKFNDEVENFVVIGRNKKKFDEKKVSLSEKLQKKISFQQIDILDIRKNLDFSDSLENNYFDGLFFVIGETGDPALELENYEKCQSNYNINLIHPVLIINSLLPKIKKK